MARIYIPKETALVKALRGFGAPQEKPPGNLVLKKHLNPKAVFLFRPGEGAHDLTGRKWTDSGNPPTFLHDTEAATLAVGDQGDLIKASTFYGMNSLRYYSLLNSDADLVNLPFQPFTVSWIAHQEDTTYSNPAVGGWDGTDDIVFYNSSDTSGNSSKIFWRDVGGTVLEPGASYVIGDNWCLQHFVSDGTGNIYLYSNGKLIASNSVSLAGVGPFTRVEVGAWTSQWSDNTTIAFYGIFGKAFTAGEVAEHALDLFGYVCEPANDAPFIIGTAAAATSQYYIPKESPLVKALRGVGAPGSQPTVALKPKADAKIKAHYLGGASETDFYLPSGATFHNKGHSIVNGEQGLESTATASYVEQINLSDTVGEKTVVMRIKFPLTRQYEMLLFGNGITTGVHQLIRNSTANAIGVWPWNQLLDVTGFDGLVTLVLPMKASLMQVYTSNGKFGSVTAGTGDFHHIWGDPGNDRGVTFGSLFYVLDGFRSAAECRSLAYDPYQVFEPANQSPLTIGTAAAGGGVDITVPQGDLILSSTVPTISATANISVTVPQANLTLSTTAPTVDAAANVAVTVPQADLALSASAPTVERTDNQSIEIPQGDLTLSSEAPTVSAGFNITVPGSNLILSTLAPAITQTTTASIIVPTADLLLSTSAPTVEVAGPVSIEVPQANLSLSTSAPTVVDSGQLWTEVAAASSIWTEI